MREREIKEHELRLLEEQVGSSNAAMVRRCSTLVSIFLWLKELPPRLARRASSRAEAVRYRDAGSCQGRAGEADGS